MAGPFAIASGLFFVAFAVGDPLAPAHVEGAPLHTAPAAIAPDAARALAVGHALVARGAHADPGLVLPPLRWVDPALAETVWASIGLLDAPADQVKAIAQSGVRGLACRDLVDVRGLAEALASPIGFRDDTRGRSWARPALARVLLRAQARFAGEYPSARLTVGDIAQPGCGQLAYGTLVRQFAGASVAMVAQPLLRAARRVLGEPMVLQETTAAEFPDEKDRFDHTDQRVLVETRVLGVAGNGVGAAPDLVRTATRRFVQLPPPKKARAAQRQVAKMRAAVERLLASGELVRHQAVRTWDPDRGEEVVAWLQHRVDKRKGLQLHWIGSRAIAGAPHWESLVEVRLSSWKPGKPESFAGELRWRPQRDEAGTVAGWDRWKMLHEAGHMSHAGGRDADLGFVTVDNRGMSHVRLKKLDVAATYRWMELLAETAQQLGTPLEGIFVGKHVRHHMNRRLSRDHRQADLWQNVVKVVPGHDAHHHVRLAMPTAHDDAVALAELKGEPVRSAGTR
ncbi:MAG: hypothetical protein FJ100_17225 [Deltaproteobacteria bacterium]|nr:hypothetical protein [Deltaproteobacteria bacterium]